VKWKNRVRIIFPLVAALSLAGIEKTYSEDKPVTAPAPEPATTPDQTPAPPGDTSTSDKPSSNENTMDEIHKRVELGILNYR